MTQWVVVYILYTGYWWDNSDSLIYIICEVTIQAVASCAVPLQGSLLISVHWWISLCVPNSTTSKSQNLRVKFWAPIYQVWFDCPLCDYCGVLASVVTTVMIVSSLFCFLIVNSCPLLAFTRDDSRVVWLPADHHFTSPGLFTNTSNIPHLVLPPSIPHVLSAQTDKYLFPRQGLLTASKSPSAQPLEKKTALFCSHWGESYIHAITVSHLSSPVGLHSVNHPSEGEQWHYCHAINSMTAWWTSTSRLSYPITKHIWQTSRDRSSN